MTLLMEELNLTIPEYSKKNDPSKREENTLFEWTIPEQEVKRMRALYEAICCKSKKKKIKLENDIGSPAQLKKPKLLNGDKVMTDIKAEVSAESESAGPHNGTVIKEEAGMETVDLTSDEFDSKSSLLDAGFSNPVVKNEIISC